MVALGSPCQHLLMWVAPPWSVHCGVCQAGPQECHNLIVHAFTALSASALCVVQVLHKEYNMISTGRHTKDPESVPESAANVSTWVLPENGLGCWYDRCMGLLELQRWWVCRLQGVVL